MKIVNPNTLYKGVILPALTTILVVSAIGLAIIYENVRPVFVETVIICCFQISGKSDDRDK
ncbi:hypothetical protein [Nostoc sp. UHCC 0870]|uniref:hypothetical protein n=1 Tax=Nostoc sp. UHCC 0870 TaxID=2914041 RepID=UPI001EDDF5B7|nr:hypothetical protein [Nostoc sp. UHCC 0870]UKP01399.1 hypothetical protein L6494_29805 [Nostoc sp. UHCC 0870]